MTEIKAEATRLTTSIIHFQLILLWKRQTLKTGLQSLVNKHVPSKMTSTRHNQPWVNTNIKRLAKQKQRAYKKAKQTQKWERYRSLKSELQRSCRQSHDQYVNNLITDAGSSAKKKTVKSKRKDKVEERWPDIVTQQVKCHVYHTTRKTSRISWTRKTSRISRNM